MKSLMHSTSSSILLPLSPSLPLPLSLQTHPPCIRLLAFCFQLIFWLFSHLSAAFTPLLSKCPLWLIFRLFTLFVISFPKLFHFSAGLFFKKKSELSSDCLQPWLVFIRFIILGPLSMYLQGGGRFTAVSKYRHWLKLQTYLTLSDWIIGHIDIRVMCKKMGQHSDLMTLLSR